MIKLDPVQTLAFAGVVLMLGYWLCQRIGVLQRYSIPEPVVGGLVIALVAWAAHSRGATLFQLDTSLQSALMIAFFTSVGFNASLSLLKVSGPQVALFLLICSVFATVQNLVGISVATVFGLHPMFGVLAGSATLTGGPATGLAFAPLFEQAGVRGADSIAVTAAMAGIVLGGLVGGPVVTRLIGRAGIRVPGAATPKDAGDAPAQDLALVPADEHEREHIALKSIVLMLVALWIGSVIDGWLKSHAITLPAYIGAMMVGAIVRNIDDYTGWFGLSMKTTDMIGNICLALFLAVALMNLKLWELAGLALPLLVILAVQLVLVVLVAGPVYRLMGRDYDGAVMAGGFIGFMLGTTANAMAVMQKLVQRFGAAPRAWMVAPLVGAFFIDFTNALIITGFINFWPQ
ncbi:sodium/glutamate symporter [Luteimonas sp. e5]